MLSLIGQWNLIDRMGNCDEYQNENDAYYKKHGM
jgi:hypothetical protein